VLVLTSGVALGGAAVLPVTGAVAADQPVAAPVAAPAPAPTPAPAVLAARAEDLAQELAEVRQHERASRDRGMPPPVAATPPPPPPPPPPPQFVRPGIGRLTSGYGWRWGRLHAGIDLAAGTGSPVSAVAAGTVVAAGPEGGYGRLVRVQHDDGALTLYAHLSELHVTVGQRVTAGTYVGREGSSGNSTGPHLHFEVRIDSVPVDPAPWLMARGIDPTQPLAPPPS
jgi:murein DD-endopeptidase MepM/ murein hydrolase activator NlpD